MDRDKEIIDASEMSRYNGEILYKDGFIDGARWSDKNNIIRWYKVEDCLPEIGERVIVMDINNNISIGTLLEGNTFSIEGVTYWMSLPKKSK